MQDLWALFSVDIREVFTGSCAASWVLGFVERAFHHPESVARARLFGGDQWADWYCWGKTEAKIAEGSDVLIAAHTPAGTTPKQVWAPRVRSHTEVLSMEATAALLMGLPTT